MLDKNFFPNTNIRSKFYWSIDKLQDSRLYKDYNNIYLHFFNFNCSDMIKEREIYLQNLLNFACENVEFYKNISPKSGLDPFPVVNKLSFINNLGHFLSKKHNKSKLYTTTTSGSTGTPFRIYKDKRKQIRHQADNILFSLLANYSIGSKLFYTRVWNNINHKNWINKFMTNISAIEISNSSDFHLLNFLKKVANYNGKKSILGFASFFESLAQYILHNRNKIPEQSVESLISMSEHLPLSAQQILEDYFNCKCFSRYSNMENGFIAQQYYFEDGRYLLNHGSFIVEIFDINYNTLLNYNQIGRIVVTDLFNYAMPFIRYDTGDLGVMRFDHETNYGPYLEKVEGRITDFIYNTKSELLSPHAITNCMWAYDDIKQFQFLQYDRSKYKILLNYNGSYYPRENELTKNLMKYIGEDAVLEVELVNEIPLLASGKRKKIVNLYKSFK